MRTKNRTLSLLALTLLLSCLSAAPAGALRVVSLMPSYTEIVFALGAGGELVGVSNFCNWPPEAEKIEKTGDYLRPNVEKIYSLKPDLVFSGDWAGSQVEKQLSSLHIKVARIPEEKNVADIFSTINLIAAKLGRKAEAGKLVKELRAALPAEKSTRPVTVYFETDAGGWTTGGKAFISDVISLAGGANVFGREKKGYFQASWEEVLLLDPQAVVLLSGSREEFLKRPMASGLAAVKAGRVITTLDRDVFSRPGPRIFGEINKLKALLQN
ncbi:MAG TPA: hypothetical protein DCZ92_02545 [Elusimicrobia bacterium]|nr:MAG: hypothetical protein A2016_00230 [Elusimicrobia bacterium GWF2_62_30]HBA59702.1 hypothetical protein [Elusimicrobiota bacterium]